MSGNSGSKSVDRAAAAAAISAFLKAIGRNVSEEPELASTPRNVTDAFLDDLLTGYAVDVRELVNRGSCATPPGQEDLVVVRDLAVSAFCPHHLMPSLGTATVVYLPGARVLGLGTLARLVDAFSRRLVLQETIARSVVDALSAHAGARGAQCLLTLRHTCFSCRGPRQAQASVTTAASSGVLLEPYWAARAESLLALPTTGGVRP
jgi:GTP cyclohydrolase I